MTVKFFIRPLMTVKIEAVETTVLDEIPRLNAVLVDNVYVQSRLFSDLIIIFETLYDSFSTL